MAWTVTPSGDGSVGNPWQITTILQMEEIGTDSHLTENFILMNDIDASETKTWHYDSTTKKYFGFDPIGSSGVGAYLTGNFNGNSKTISNLYIYRPTTTHVGLFAYVNLGMGGELKDLTVSNAEITGLNYVGILAGVIRNTNDWSMTDCHVSGTVTTLGMSSGGCIGWIEDVDDTITITDCDSNVTITKTGATTPGVTASYLGGFIGNAAVGDGLVISSCHSSGMVIYSGTVADGSANYIALGGFAGSISAATSCYSNCVVMNTTHSSVAIPMAMGGFCGFSNGTLTLCYATGDVVSTSVGWCRMGGFIGWHTATASKCMASGSIEASSASVLYAGGFSGLVFNSTNCYSIGDVCKTGIQNTSVFIGGFSGGKLDTTSVTVQNCYSTGYVNTTSIKGGGFYATGVTVTNLTFTSCYWDTETSGWETTGAGASTTATGKATSEMEDIATFTDWDFDTIWESTTGTQAGISASNLTVWPSATGDYDKFLEGTKDADSFQTDIPSTNEIRWIDSQEALLIGTAGDEWKLASNKLDTPLSPTNHGPKRQSGHGSAHMQAINVNEVILFADFVGRKIREMSFDQQSEKYVCPDMTALSEHVTAGKIKWMAYQKNPDSILWVGMENGDLRGFIYDREQNVTAWFKVILGGDAACQSGCVIPSITEDIVYLIVNRTITGSTVYDGEDEVYSGDDLVVIGGGDKVYLERFTSRELTVLADCFFVDCGVSFDTPGADVDYEVYAGDNPVYSGTDQVVMAVFDSTAPVSTITGLDHLDGETVSILADGVVADDAIVSGGEVTILIGGVETTASKAQVGLAYTSKLQPMRIVLGESMGKKTRVNKLVVSLLDTGAAKYGADDNNLHDMDLTEIGITNTSEITGLLTGEIEVSQSAGFDPLNPIIISSDKPLPLTVRCIVADIDRTG